MPEIRRPFAMNLAALPDGKVTIEDRTDKATPEPGLSKKEWESLRHVSATFYVGADRGNRPVNRKDSCAADGDAYPTDVVDKRFRAMRTLLLKEKKADAADFEASRTIMEGWYGGKPASEHSAAYQIIYKGPKYAPRGEKTEKQFKEAMRHLASGVSALLCQDEVLVVFDVPEGKFTESYSGGPKDRQRADVLRTAKGFEGVERPFAQGDRVVTDTGEGKIVYTVTGLSKMKGGRRLFEIEYNGSRNWFGADRLTKVDPVPPA